MCINFVTFCVFAAFCFAEKLLWEQYAETYTMIQAFEREYGELLAPRKGRIEGVTRDKLLAENPQMTQIVLRRLASRLMNPNLAPLRSISGWIAETLMNYKDRLAGRAPDLFQYPSLPRIGRTMHDTADLNASAAPTSRSSADQPASPHRTMKHPWSNREPGERKNGQKP